MPDEQLPETPPPVTTPPAATAQQPAASASPLDLPEVKAAIERAKTDAAEHARNATWKQARETLARKPNGTATTAPEQQPMSPPTAPPAAAGMTLEDLATYDAFKAAASEHGIPARGASMLLKQCMTEKPADVPGWVAKEAASYGWTKPTATTTTATAPASSTPATTSAPPVTGNGAPAAPTTITADTPILSLSNADRIALQKKMGPAAFTDRMLKELEGRKATLR